MDLMFHYGLGHLECVAIKYFKHINILLSYSRAILLADFESIKYKPSGITVHAMKDDSVSVYIHIL